MVANTRARALEITINGTDYSEYVSQFNIGFESYAQGKGLITKTGSIILESIVGGVNLDPRDNYDFLPGSEVVVTWDGNPHPIAGNLFVIASPAVDLLNDRGVFDPSNIRLDIPVGCTLAFYRTREYDEDKTGVVYGAPLAGNVVIENLLKSAGIPDAKISLTLPRVDIDFPYSKFGNGFVDLAGEFAYSTYSSENPSFLYCDNTNVVRDSSVTSVSPVSTITVGVDDREYLPQIDSTPSVGIVQVSGTRHSVLDKTADYPLIITEKSESDGSTTTTKTTYYNVNRQRVFLIDRKLLSVSFFVPDTQSWKAVTLFPRVNYRISKVTVTPPFDSELPMYLWTFDGYSKAVESINTIDGEVKTSNTEEHSVRFFKDNKLHTEMNLQYVQDDSYAVREGDANGYLVVSRHTITRYSYDSKDVLQRRETVTARNYYDVAFGQGRGVDFPTNVLRDGYVTNILIEIWRDDFLSKTEYVLDGIIKPYSFNPIASFRFKVKAKTSVAGKSRGTPGTTYWDGGYVDEQETLKASVTMGTGSNVKRYTITVPFAFSEEQLQSIASVEGKVANGRQHQYIVECDPDLLSSVSVPMSSVSVIEPDTTERFFLADALSWVHDRNEDSVGFAGIYTGSSAGTPQDIESSPDISGRVTIGGLIDQDLLSGILYG